MFCNHLPALNRIRFRASTQYLKSACVGQVLDAGFSMIDSRPSILDAGFSMFIIEMQKVKGGGRKTDNGGLIE
jgi:hypothetical protein